MDYLVFQQRAKPPVLTGGFDFVLKHRYWSLIHFRKVKSLISLR